MGEIPWDTSFFDLYEEYMNLDQHKMEAQMTCRGVVEIQTNQNNLI